MKTTFCLLSVLVSAFVVQAQDACVQSESYPTTSPSVVYTSPVVYQSSVVYQAPVAYHAPVYYVASAMAAASYVSPEHYYPAPSSVIHITGGRGTYTSTRYSAEGESTVVYIGGRHPRQHSYHPYYPRYRR
jgi:hypothetical protein